MFNVVVPFEVTVDDNPEQLCRFDSLKRVVLGFKARLESLDHDPSLVRDSFKSHVGDSNSLTAQWM